MEPVTQALLGAATAEWVAGKSLGRGRALGWGAIIGMFPDLDVLLGPLRDGYGEWLYHRGTTHSLWFGFAAGPILGALLWKWRDPEAKTPLQSWIALAIVALVTHPILDGFTPYGTQFFAPFSRARFAWNGVAIVDPAYSLMLGFGVFAVASAWFRPTNRRRILGAALVFSSAYLLIGVGLHSAITRDIEHMLKQEYPQLRIERVRAYPTIFQPWLRSFVARTDQGLYTGLHSWQQWDCPSWQIHPAATDSPEAQDLLRSWEGELLLWFADGDLGAFTQAAPPNSNVRTVRLEDLRYGWASAQARGMWGIEARFESGQRIGPITRIARPEPTPGDLGRILRLLRGRLPEASASATSSPLSEGWHRPKHCSPSSASAAAYSPFQTSPHRSKGFSS